MDTTNKLIKQSKELLAGLDWPTYAQPVTDKAIGLEGYFFKNNPYELKDLWLGIIQDAPIKGIILGAKPQTDEAVKRVLIEGFKWLKLIKPDESGWFYKRLISPGNIRRLAKMSKAERAKCLKMLLENTYPFASE
jgi:hypothetical protein